MNIQIEIECEDKQQLLNHLMVIVQNLLPIPADTMELENIRFEDSNCYGEHEVKIESDDTKGSFDSPVKYINIPYENLAQYKEDTGELEKYLSTVMQELDEYKKEINERP